MKAYLLEIGSDDDNITADQVRQLPIVTLPANVDQLEFDESGYYTQLLEEFDVYFDDNENAYLTPKKGN